MHPFSKLPTRAQSLLPVAIALVVGVAAGMAVITAPDTLFGDRSKPEGTSPDKPPTRTVCKEAPSALTGSKVQLEAAANCVTGQSVEEAVLQLGSRSASVTVSTREGDFLDTEQVVSVIAFVDFPKAKRRTIDGEALARVLATVAGTTTEHVVIRERTLGVVFDGAKASAGAEQAAETAASGATSRRSSSSRDATG